MDYLRKHHGNDNEKMQMVALKFGMFRELAKTREDQARRDLRRVRSRHLGETGWYGFRRLCRKGRGERMRLPFFLPLCGGGGMELGWNIQVIVLKTVE